MEREKFEESLRNAFDNAEVTPSERVWTNVELDLEKARGGQLKKRLMFYQMLAAASVVFAMAIGGIGYYNNSLSREAGLAMQPATSSDTNNETSGISTARDLSAAEGARDGNAQEDTPSIGGDGPSDNAALQKGIALNTDTDTDTKKDHQLESGRVSSQRSGFSPAKTGDLDNASPIATDISGERNRDNGATTLLAFNDRALPPLYTPREIQLNFKARETEVDPVLAMLARLDLREKEVQGEKKNKSDRGNKNENLWTSIGFAAGSFNSVQSSVSGSDSRMKSVMAATAPTVEEETKASGYSYSMGVNVGTKLSEKWVFQGGVNYLTHASQYTANNVVAASGNYQQQRFRAASTNEMLNFDAHEVNTKVVYTAPYDVNNNMRYLSIPMQAGYLLVNKTLGLQLNAGVATDLFLQNTVTADSDQLDKATQPGGSDSPYRAVNLSGLFGTEVSYRFGEHYRVSLNPGIRYPFSSIYKTDLGLQSTPLTFDVGLRFRYIFH